MSRVVVKSGASTRSPFVVDFSEGEWIFAEGDLGTEMYIIQDGRVEVFKQVRGEERRLALLEKGDFFGELAILDGLPRTASARALERTRVVEVNGSTFGQMLTDNPEIAIRMMRKLSRRLRTANEYLREVGGLELIEAEDPQPPPRPLAAQYLLFEPSGEKFFLSADRETTIGRQDPVTNIHPGIDLTPVDPKRSTSRRHATVHRRADKFFLTEEIGTANGTYVERERLQTGAPREMEDGDTLRFGLVELTFHVGG